MKETLKISFFKEKIETMLHGFDVKYFSFNSGSFGSHNKVVFTKNNIEGYIDFYKSNWIEVHIFDFRKEHTIVHTLMDSDIEIAVKKEKINDAIKQALER